MTTSNRHLINAQQTLNRTISELVRDTEGALWTYHNGELSTTKLILRILSNKRGERKAIQAYNRAVVINR